MPLTMTTIRLSEEHIRLAKALAAKMGEPSVSAILRQALYQMASREMSPDEIQRVSESGPQTP